MFADIYLFVLTSPGCLKTVVFLNDSLPYVQCSTDQICDPILITFSIWEYFNHTLCLLLIFLLTTNLGVVLLEKSAILQFSKLAVAILIMVKYSLQGPPKKVIGRLLPQNSGWWAICIKQTIGLKSPIFLNRLRRFHPNFS